MEKTGRPEKPGKTEKPGETEKPETTESPRKTRKPRKTENPGETEKPGTTEKPGATEKPEIAEKPGKTKKPEAKPDKPEKTDNPEKTELDPSPQSATKEKQAPSWRDILVITILWNSQIVFCVIDGFTRKFTEDHFTRKETEKIKDARHEGAVLAITLISMMTMATLLTLSSGIHFLKNLDRFRFWIMLGGLSFYFISAIVGILLPVTRSMTVAIIMIWMEIGWYTVQPIRFCYIFHQKFPLSVRWSHLLVSGNILATLIIEYLVLVFVRASTKQLSPTLYGIAFGIMTLVAAVWIYGTYFIKRFLNPVSGDLNSVRAVYVKTEVIENFNNRQSFVSIIFFLGLISPAMVFPVMNAYMDIGHQTLLQNALLPDLGLCIYRPDLLLAVVTLVVIECVLQALKIIRNEFTELVLITITHILNIVVILFFMYTLYITREVRDEVPLNGEAILVVNHDNIKDGTFVQIGIGGSGQFEVNFSDKCGFSKVLRNIPEDGMIPIRFANRKTGVIYHDTTVHVEKSHRVSVTAYNVLRNRKGESEFIKVNNFPTVGYKYNARVVVENGCEECADFNMAVYKEMGLNPNFTRGMIVHGRCLPVMLQYFAEGMRDRDDQRFVFYKPPANNDTLVFEVPCNASTTPETVNPSNLCVTSMFIFYKLLEYMKLAITDLPKGRGKITVKVKFNVSIAPTSILVYRFENELVPLGTKGRIRVVPYLAPTKWTVDRKEHEIRLLTPMCIYGVSLGIAWVGYIHFIWIRSPVRCRTLVIFSFFALMLAASSITKILVPKFNAKTVYDLFIFAQYCLLCHVVATVLFGIRMLMSRKQQQPQQPWRRY